MPTLPIQGSAALDGGALPVNTSSDVLAVFPVDVRRANQAMVRDALAAALREIHAEYQRRSRRCVALSDVLRSTGVHLDGLLRDHGVYRQPGELDTAFRARFLGVPSLVTPAAVMAAVNAVLAPYTTKRAVYFEPNVDRWFVCSGDAPSGFASFVFARGVHVNPRYPDRLFVDDSAINDGVSLGDRGAISAWVPADAIGRHFVVRIPNLGAPDSVGSYVSLGATSTMFIGDGTDTDGAESSGEVISFVYETRATARDIYAAIVSAVETIKGHGIRWSAIIDPAL